MQYPYHPNGRGFDEFYGFCSGHWGNYFNPPLEHNGRLVRGKGFVIDDFTNQAMRFIETSHREGKPFFAYLPFNTPHSPMQVPERFWKKFADADLKMHNREPNKENLPHVRAALAMCENIDWNVGRLLEKLESLGITKDTIVVYFCDNGPNGVRWNGDMRGRKGSTDEGGVRSPLLIRWPGAIPKGKQVTQISAAIDLLPTLADLAGIPAQPNSLAGPHRKQFDGKSVKPLLFPTPNSSPQHWPERLLYSTWKGRVSVRSQRFRLDHQGKLYDIAADPGQRKNVAQRHVDATQRLSAAAEAFRKEVLQTAGKDERTFLIGHEEYRYTQVPARDGVPHGGIKRSNRFPNCSYFTHWTSRDDSITWDAEVAAAGDYEIEMHYACPPDSVGAEIELSFGDAKLVAKIEEAANPPIRGQEHDRVKRGESYVKDFATMKLGILHLEQGKGELRLRATKIPGKQVGEFRLLMFTRK